MTVWIVNPFDNLPQEGYRPQRYWLMARAFARAGHDVVYWSSDFSHAKKAGRVEGPNVEASKRSAGCPPLVAEGRWIGDGFRLVLVPTPAYSRNICLRRIASHRAFARRWRKMAEREARKPDVVIASLPPLAAADAARAFCRKAGVRFVADVQDAWPETFERVAPRFLLAPLRRLARRIYRAADGVSGVAERYLDLARAYGSTAPQRLAPLAIDPEGPVPVRGARTPGAPLRLVYAGNMGASYDLETVIAGVKALPDVTLDLAGTGPKEAALRALAAGCDRIRFHGYLDAAALREILARADAGLVPMFDDACVGVPGKMADYTAAGLPVINSLHGETERLLADAGAGVTCPAGDADAFCAAVKGLTALDEAAWTALAAGARNLFGHFDAEKIFPAYVEWVTEGG